MRVNRWIHIWFRAEKFCGGSKLKTITKSLLLLRETWNMYTIMIIRHVWCINRWAKVNYIRHWWATTCMEIVFRCPERNYAVSFNLKLFQESGFHFYGNWELMAWAGAWIDLRPYCYLSFERVVAVKIYPQWSDSCWAPISWSWTLYGISHAIISIWFKRCEQNVYFDF